jgi:hypothetical protein
MILYCLKTDNDRRKQVMEAAAELILSYDQALRKRNRRADPATLKRYRQVLALRRQKPDVSQRWLASHFRKSESWVRMALKRAEEDERNRNC